MSGCEAMCLHACIGCVLCLSDQDYCYFSFRIEDLKTDLHSETSSFQFVSLFLSNKNLSTLVSVINLSILQRDAGGF